MGVKRVQDLIAYQLSLEFKRAVYELVQAHSRANGDLRYRDQLFDAALSVSANIAEGFSRHTTRDFYAFLSYARGSLSEALTRTEDGVDRGHFSRNECEGVCALGRRVGETIGGLQRSLRPFLPNKKP